MAELSSPTSFNDYSNRSSKYSNDDDDDYRRFVTSVLLNNEEGNSFTLSDDDEDEYKPEDVDEDPENGSDGSDSQDCDTDFTDDDVELKKVNAKEVQDLFDDCWQTLNSSNTVVLNSQNLEQHNSISSNAGHIANLTGSIIGGPSFNTSNFVREISLGRKISEIAVNGTTIDIMRKLIARQLSMATQLLLQLMVYSSKESACFQQAYQSLVELMNYREKSLKKSILTKLNMQNLTNFNNNMYRNNINNNSSNNNSSSSNISSGKSETPSPSHLHNIAHTTRSTTSTINSSSMKAASVFDVPFLTNKTQLFEFIDKCHVIKKKMDYDAVMKKHPMPKAVGTSGRCSGLQNRLGAVEELNSRIREYCKQINGKMWTVCMPSRAYPICSEAAVAVDPASLAARSMFSPAEDDLLLRGFRAHRDQMKTESEDLLWRKISVAYLPSKEDKELSLRFTQLLSYQSRASLVGAPESESSSSYTKISRYFQLVRENRLTTSDSGKWRHEEDMLLLRGFSVYGEKWSLVGIFFLPGRSKQSIEKRWQSLLFKARKEKKAAASLSHPTSPMSTK